MPRNSSIWMAAAVVLLAARGFAQTPAGGEDPNRLSLQVTALRTLYTLNLSPEQLGEFRTLANGAADPSQRKTAKVTPKLLAAIKAAKTALLGKDDDAISDADDALDEAWDTENFEIADSVAMTDAARTGAEKAMKLLKAEQMVTYIAQISSDVFEPSEGMMEAADDVAGKSDADYLELRDKTGDEVAIAVCGMDAAKAAALKEKVAAWLDKVHGMKPGEETAQHAALEAEAKGIAGDVEAMTVLRNEVERNLAELLANPESVAMIDAKSKSANE